MTWSYSDYQTVSDAVFSKMILAAEPGAVTSGKPSTPIAAVIAYGKDGDSPNVKQYSDSASASDAYDALVNAPGQLWWISLYDSAKSASADGRVDETYLGGVNEQTTTTVTKTETKTKTVKSSAGWGYVAAFFGSLLGIAALSKKKR